MIESNLHIEKNLVLCIDQGTTSTRVALIDNKLKIIMMEQIEHEQIHENPGWTEHDPMQLYFNVNLLIDRIHMKNKDTIGITNQRETCLAWNKQTGEHYCNAIVWHDTRTIKIVDDLIKKHNDNKDVFRKICGLPINTYFSAVKIKWMLENVEQIRTKMQNNDYDDLCFGTIDSWLVYKLTGNFFTDVTNASRTLLMNLNSLQWDIDMLAEFGIPIKVLPTILNSTDYYGTIQKGFLKGVPITGVIGDQQSACLGHLLEIGEVKNTYGTGCFILMNTGNQVIHSNFGLLSTVLYKNKNNLEALYALEGAIESAGSVLSWLKNNLKLFSDYDMIPAILNTVENNGGVIFVPAFSGLFSPYWDNTARGLLIGLSLYTQPGHILRAAFEAISMRTYEVIQSFEKDSGIKLKCLKVDGGLTNSKEFLQIQSDVLSAPVEKQSEKEITIIGASIAAGLEESVQVWRDFTQLKNLIHVENVFQPERNRDYFNELYLKWSKAVEKSKNWI